jgi:Tol biopolymer transport system component
MRAGAAALAAVILMVSLLCGPLDAANRYDPRFRFRTISTPRFNIYFHQREEALARRLARVAEEVAETLRRELGVPTGRVHVILVDQGDLSNGWAIPTPYNLIEITAAAPSGESSIGNTDDWLRVVFSHEYTHIVHLDKARGWIGGLRGVFGRAPALYPNLFLPLWQIEGIATYNESALTGEGRVPAGDFRMIVDRAAAAGRFDPVDRANGGLVDWPGGAAQYAYGAYFHQYLADRFGPESLVLLSDETARRLPYFGAPAFRKVFKRSLGALWDDFQADARQRVPREDTIATRLTRHGFSVGSPRFSESGRLFYSIGNPHGFPALMELPRDGSAPRQVATKYLGGQIATAGGLLVFDQVELVENVGLQSDLYSVRQDGGRTRRLTHGARAAYPDISPDRHTIVCTVQSADRRALATLSLDNTGRMTQPALLISEASTNFSSPRWSPDGRSIAAERRALGGPSEIVVVDSATGRARALAASPDGRNVSPFWLADGKTILFASDRGGKPFAIYSVDVETGRTRRLNGASLGAQSPTVSPDGGKLVFVGYSVEGFDLFSMRMDAATWTDVGPETTVAATSAPAGSGSEPDPPSRPYRPWPTLAPRFWTPIVESDNGEITAGAGASGADALGRHAYFGGASWSASRPRPDWSFGYAYDRWWPTLFANVSDDTDPWRDGEVRAREMNAGAVFPVRRVRWTQVGLVAVNGSSDAFDCPSCEPAFGTVAKRRALRLGWSFDNAKSYGYSIGKETGTSLRATSEITRRGLGADGNAAALTLDARAYRRAFPRHGVVAARVAAASSSGDRRVRRLFSAAGAGPPPAGFSFGTDAVGLLRGFAEDAITGDRAVVGNLDYRVPLASIQRGIGTLPFFLRTAHAAVFADAGHAWTDDFRWSDLRTAFGAELSLDTVLSYIVPLTFTAGGAWRNNPVTGRRGFAAFGRVGRAF